MSTGYEQEVTIRLTQTQATHLIVALNEYLRSTQASLESNPSYRGETPAAGSGMDFVMALRDDLRQVSLGHNTPGNRLATWRTIRKEDA